MIFALAMDINPIQGLAVPCEQVFSSSKETTTAQHNHLSPELMEALQMLKCSFKRGRGLDFTAGTSQDAELEELTRLTASLLEDMSDFIIRKTWRPWDI
jgi:hypothetical protein